MLNYTVSDIHGGALGFDHMWINFIKMRDNPMHVVDIVQSYYIFDLSACLFICMFVRLTLSVSQLWQNNYLVMPTGHNK